MEEEKNASLNLFKILKKYIYSYPLGWFVIGFLLLFYLNLYYNVFDYRNPFRSLLTFAIIFSFSIINIVANYDKSRSKIKWLFWDCLASMYLLCFSFIYVLAFVRFEEGFWYLIGFSNIDMAIWLGFHFVVGVFKGFSFYVSIISEKINYLLGDVYNFESLDGFLMFTPVFICIIIYDIYKKKTIKEILRTRCFLMLFMLSLSRISLLIAFLLC